MYVFKSSYFFAVIKHVMKIKINIFLFCISLCFFLLYACSSTKYVPDNEYLLQDVEIKIDAKDISYFDLEPYLKQKQNFKTFEVFKFPLFMYNLSSKDTTKWLSRTLRKGGEAPVIYDSTLVNQSADELYRLVYNKGYLNADVHPEIILKNKKAIVKYNIESGLPTKIDNYTINISDTVFPKDILNRKYRDPQNRKDTTATLSLNEVILKGSLLKKGDHFDLDLLDSERERITTLLKSRGFLDFDKKYINFIADTINKVDLVDLELIIDPYIDKVGENISLEVPHHQYYVDRVDIYIDYNPLTDGNLADFHATDTVFRGDYRIFYGTRGRYIKPFIILNSCYIEPGKLYSESRTSMTYNALSQLSILRNVNIQYDDYLEGNTTKLRCIITAVPDKKQGIMTEIEGTNSAGFFGVGSSIGYTHRNVFKGSELFNIKAKGAYEAVTPNFSSFSDNYFEIGGEASLTFPRFMFPFLSHDLRRKLRATTQFVSSYTFQRRPDYFTRTIFSTGLKYLWEDRRNGTIRHTLDLIDVSYVHLPKLYPRLESTLSQNAKIYSFTDQFIISTGYTYTKTNTNSGFYTSNKRNKSTYSLRASFETAGNGLSLIAALSDIKKDENGARKIFDTYYAQYVKGNFDYSKSIKIDDKNAIAWRLGAGVVYPYGNSKLVPFEKRFFAGGANSVRGWNVRELGPGAFYLKDANFNDQSGDIRFDANIEYRTKAFWKLGFAAFLDAGNIWTIKGEERQYKGDFKFDKFYKQIASAWGLGIRLDFDFLLLRLDCGWKLYDPADVPKYKIDESGYGIVDGYKSKWKVVHPFKISENTAWHIAVGYPF